MRSAQKGGMADDFGLLVHAAAGTPAHKHLGPAEV
jgi:hypothetical protein